MSTAAVIHDPDKLINLQERKLDRTILRTYRTKADIDDIVPNDKQPRMGPKLDEELQRQIEANGGLFEPLLVEPHPEFGNKKFRIIDGDRRWTNSRALVEQGKSDYRLVPVEVTSKTLDEEERLRVWIYIHRQRKEWDAKEKEMVAYRLVEIVGRASAANILGITVRELDKLVEIFNVSEKFKSLRDPSAAITWARELMGVSKKLLTPTAVEAVVKGVNQKKITNSKDLRKLRAILPDPVARSNFLQLNDIDAAMMRLSPVAGTVKRQGPLSNLDTVLSEMKNMPWTTLQELKGNDEILNKLAEAEVLLQSLRKALS